MAKEKAAPKKSSRAAENSGKQRRAAKPPATTLGKQAAAAEIAEKQRRAGILATSGLLHAAAVMEPLQKNLVGADATTDAIFSALETKLDLVKSGDLAPVESMLLSQAMSLQTLYASLARKATSQEYLKQYQVHLTLALKAQAQSRATLEALVELKHPRHSPTFVKQANIANGPQQINQHMYATMQSHKNSPAEDPHAAPNKLLEEIHERLDTGAAATPGRGHQDLEAVGAIDRTEDGRG